VKVIVEAEDMKLNGKLQEQGAEIDMPAEAVADAVERGLVSLVPKAELKERLAEARESGDVAEAAALETDPGLAPRRRSKR